MELSLYISTFADSFESSSTVNYSNLLRERTFSFNRFKRLTVLEKVALFLFLKSKVISGFSIIILLNILVIGVFTKRIIDLRNIFK